MSALAKLMLSRGHAVSGSDAVRSGSVNKLIKAGARIRIGRYLLGVHTSELVIYTAAIAGDNPDLVLAKKLNKPIMERAVFLAAVAAEYNSVVAVSGTHGKTTTTAMLADILIAAGLNPTVHLGGHYSKIGGNLHIGGKQVFVTEACEFNKSFLHIFPGIAVITNIEADHLDCYGTFDEIVRAFTQFAHQTKKTVVINADSLKLSNFVSKAEIIDTGLSLDNMFSAAGPASDRDGNFSFDLFNKNNKLCRINLSVAGRYQIYNALSAAAAASALGVKAEIIAAALEAFSGVDRRFQEIYYENGIRVIHDYAHHPTEVRAALSAAAAKTSGKLYCVFQPHTYTRTRNLMQEFTACFSEADVLYLVPTYAAREAEIPGAGAQNMAEQIKDVAQVAFFEQTDELCQTLKNNITSGDTVIFLGAGTIDGIADEFAKYLRQTP